MIPPFSPTPTGLTTVIIQTDRPTDRPIHPCMHHSRPHVAPLFLTSLFFFFFFFFFFPIYIITLPSLPSSISAVLCFCKYMYSLLSVCCPLVAPPPLLPVPKRQSLFIVQNPDILRPLSRDAPRLPPTF
ncbi:hypothetical protein IWX49DRAFT_576879, partial [Phyllosticta citricarpa]